MVLSGVVAAITFTLVFLHPGWVLVSFLKIYYFIVVYSLYEVFKYGDEQEAYQAHQHAKSAGYEEYYEPEGYNNIQGYENGYQTTELREP